jgi:hypothetical protein
VHAFLNNDPDTLLDGSNMLKRIVATMVAILFAFAGSMGACGISIEQCAAHADACVGHDSHDTGQTAPHGESAPDSDAPTCHGCACTHGHGCDQGKFVGAPPVTGQPDCNLAPAHAPGASPRISEILAEIFIPPKLA